MNSVDFREKFQKYLADDNRYKKFIVLINNGRSKRLLFWQEKIIESFCDQNSIEVPNFDYLQEIFSVCEIHGDLLEDGEAKIFQGHVDYSLEYKNACMESFPNSYLSEINGPEESFGKYVQVRICGTCRKVEKAWRNKNA